MSAKGNGNRYGKGYTRGYTYGKGYTGFSYHVTGGHEEEAFEAEMSKKPNRFGLLVLRLLGYKGTPPPPSTEGRHLPE